MLDLIKDLWGFMRERKKFWLAPILVVMLLLGVLIVLAPIGFLWPLPYHQQILFCLIGATWGFHLLWTLWIIPRDQPDLKENGTFFSLALIYLINVVLLSGLLCLASPDLHWRHFVYNWANNFMEIVAHVGGFMATGSA